MDLQRNKITYSSKIIDGENGQDFVDVIDINGIYWLIILDGHGKHFNKIDKKDLVEWLKNFNWRNFLEKIVDENPLELLQEIIEENFISTSGIGAVISLVRILPTMISVWWKGDTEVNIYEDDTKIGGTQKISILDKTEQQRLDAQGIKYKIDRTSFRPQVLNDTDITMIRSVYTVFNTKTSEIENKLAISDSLGHDGCTGKSYNKSDYMITEGKNYRIIGGSDGLFDILCEKDESFLVSRENHANEIADLAFERWEKIWNYVWRGKIVSKEKMESRDDICVVAFDFVG